MNETPNWLEVAERSGLSRLDYAIEEDRRATDELRAAGRALLQSFKELREARRELDDDDR